MNRELRKELSIDEYLELIKEDKNLNMAYISLSQYINILEHQLEEKTTKEKTFKIWLINQFNKTQDTTYLDILMKHKEYTELLEILERGRKK